MAGDVQPDHDAIAMDNVVVVGYRRPGNKLATAQATPSSIKAEISPASPAPISRDAMAAKMPGVAGAPSWAASPKPTFRSASAASNPPRPGNDPLYVIGGIDRRPGLRQPRRQRHREPRSAQDASAAAIYGSRGSCGVILITTNAARANTRRQLRRTVQRFERRKTMEMLDAYNSPKSSKEAPRRRSIFSVPWVRSAIEKPPQTYRQPAHPFTCRTRPAMVPSTGRTPSSRGLLDQTFALDIRPAHQEHQLFRRRQLPLPRRHDHRFRTEHLQAARQPRQQSATAEIRVNFALLFRVARTTWTPTPREYGGDGVIASALMAPPVFGLQLDGSTYNWI